MSSGWHPYVFDVERRRFVGDFERMYQAERREGFDSWHQSDPRRLEVDIALLLLGQVTFASAIDLGCGKGAFTVRLKRRDNRVLGVDMSETAIATAREHYPDLEWTCSPIEEFLDRGHRADLIVVREVLSYLESWPDVLARCAALARYCLVGLYLPPDPIGYVATHDELRDELTQHFTVLEEVLLSSRGIGTYLCESRAR